MIQPLSRSCWDQVGFRVKDRLTPDDDDTLERHLGLTLAWTGRADILFVLEGLDGERLETVFERLQSAANRIRGVRRVAFVVERLDDAPEPEHALEIRVFPLRRVEDAWTWLSLGEIPLPEQAAISLS